MQKVNIKLNFDSGLKKILKFCRKENKWLHHPTSK